MRVEFNRTGAERKEMVTALAAILQVKAEYLGAPSMAYRIGRFTVTRGGALEYEELDFPTGIDQILQDLERSGIEPVHTGEPETEEEETRMTIEMPRTLFTDEAIDNLKKIIGSKSALIKKAIGTDDLPVEVTDEKVSFPWFSAEDAETAKAYQDFIEKLSEMAREVKRVQAKEKEVESEKYAFRCFLLRLGFIGAEYKTDRKILLKNLEGSSAFKSVNKGGE